MPILNITDTVKSNSQYNVYMAIKNYGKEEIKNINVLIESDLFDTIKDKKNILADTTYKVYGKTLTAPYVEEEKVYNFKISGSYITSSGKTQAFEKSAQLKVTAAQKIIMITREINKEEAYPEDEIKITIKLKNKKNTIIDSIEVSDIFPKEIRSSLLGDVTASIEELNPNEEKKAYSYSVVIPKDYPEDEIEFKTTLNARIDGELTILKRIDKIKILGGEKQEDIEEEQETEEETETQVEEITEESTEQKENFFKKIISWIKNLFRKKEESQE